MSTKNRFEPHPGVVFTEINPSEGVLLHLESKRYYSLNETGLRIWGVLQGGAEVDSILGRLSEEYEVDADTTKDYVIEFLSELKREGLVEEKTA